MRAILEDVQLGIADATAKPLREPRRGHGIVAPESDLGRNGDPVEFRLDIVCDDRIGFLDECIDRLRRTSANEIG